MILSRGAMRSFKGAAGRPTILALLGVQMRTRDSQVKSQRLQTGIHRIKPILPYYVLSQLFAMEELL